MTQAIPDHTQLALLTRMLRDQRAGKLASLTTYLAGHEGVEAWVAHHYLRLTGRAADADEVPGEPAPGRRLGPYRLVRELGRGGQGAVWQARDERLDRDLALKLVPNAPAAPDAGPRFRREAMLAARLDHAAICPVYDAGSDGRVSWIAMRLVEGQTLAELSELPSRDVLLGHFQELAEALHTAHRAGVVHRDVKPQNIMLTPEGRPVLLDFGVARGEDEDAPLTLTGDALGTPAYMSPEQLSGDGVVDGRTDVWSLGVSLYQTLTGRRPFEAPTREALVRQILERDPAVLGEGFSRDLEVVVATAITKELGRRYANAQAFADDLGRVLGRQPVHARPLGAFGRAARWARREPRFAGSVAVFVIALAIALVALVAALDRTQATLGERNALLDEVDRTSDHMLVKELLDQEPALLPAHPRLQAQLDQWLTDAEALVDREEEHRGRYAQVASRVQEAPTDRRAWSSDQTRDAWLLGQLDEMLLGLEGLRDALPEMRARAAFARDLERRTITEHATEWARAAQSVAADERFAGLVLAPQIGLIPLGPDPLSGLEEFAHLASGAPATRGAGGALLLTAQTGLIFVLVPGAQTQWGSLAATAGLEEGAPWVDTTSRIYELGLLPCTIDPLLVSKYEMTQAQWERHEGKNPAYYTYGEQDIQLHPVEQVSWVDCMRVLAELDLALPTEQEWETFARAGTSTVWFFGNELPDAEGYGNVCDSSAKVRWRSQQYTYEEWLDDGFPDTAPVGSYDPNPYGLHDVIGNLNEWTRSPWSWPGEMHVPRFSERSVEGAATCVVRGGAFGSDLARCRSAYRVGYSPLVGARQVGVRPIRRLD